MEQAMRIGISDEDRNMSGLRQIGEAWPSFRECEGVFISCKLFSLPMAIRDSCLHGWILVILVILVSLCYLPISLHPSDIVVYVSYRKSRDKLSSRIELQLVSDTAMAMLRLLDWRCVCGAKRG